MNFLKRAWNATCNFVKGAVDSGKAAVATVMGGGAAVSSLVPADAHAAPPDLTSLTTAVDFSTAQTAILAVAAALIVVYIAIKASKFVLNMVRGG